MVSHRGTHSDCRIMEMITTMVGHHNQQHCSGSYFLSVLEKPALSPLIIPSDSSRLHPAEPEDDLAMLGYDYYFYCYIYILYTLGFFLHIYLVLGFFWHIYLV